MNNFRSLLQSAARALTSPAVVSVAAVLATAGAMILSSAVDTAKAELAELNEQYGARENELKEVLGVLHRALNAHHGPEVQDVLADAADRGYPAPVDVDPLERAAG